MDVVGVVESEINNDQTVDLDSNSAVKTRRQLGG